MSDELDSSRQFQPSPSAKSSTSLASARSLEHLRAIEDGDRITWRNGAPFADWTLQWGDLSDADASESAYKVHRVVLVGGSRPAHYFSYTVREGFDARGTDLSKLLPESCRPSLERTLDFIYGDSLGPLTPVEVPPLFKIADVLQCPTLRNYVLDEVNRMIGTASSEADFAVAEVLVGAAALEINELSESLIQNASVQALRHGILALSRMAPQQLAALVPVFMDRVGCGLDATWGGIEHEGGAVKLDGRVVRFRGGGTCIAWTHGEVQSGRHSWRIRVDEVHNASGFIALGVVAGPKDSGLTCDMDSWQQWYLYYSDDGKKRTKGEADLQDYSEPYAPGDIISVILDLDKRTLEFLQNDRSCGVAYCDLVPGLYRVGAELGNSASDMQITLVSYDCISGAHQLNADLYAKDFCLRDSTIESHCPSLSAPDA